VWLAALEQPTGPTLDDRIMAELAVHDLARPRSAADAIRGLLEDGEFDVVARLVEAPDTAEKIGYGTADLLKEELTLARDHAVGELRRRLDALRLRAARVGVGVSAGEEFEQAAKRRRATAMEMLGGWEREVVTAEEALARKLDWRLAALGRPDEDEWAQSVRACIQAGQLDVATFLLDSGPGQPSRGSPVLVPRLPAWPLSAPFGDTMAWLARGEGPPEFRSRWQRVEQDPVAVRAVDAVVRISTATGPIITDHVRDLVVALDALLGMDEDLAHPVEPRAGGFLTRLHGVDDPRLPHLEPLGHEGLRLYVPQDPAGGVTVGAEEIGPAAAGPLLWLSTADSETFAPRARVPGWAMLHAQTILRLVLITSHRRVNLLRDVCSQLRVRDLLPGGIGALGPLGPDDLRDLVSWVLDLLDVEAPSVLVDTILYDAGARPAVVELLLHGLIPDDRPRPLRLDLDDLRTAREVPEFRRIAREILLATIQYDHLAWATLFAARYFYEQDAQAAFDPDDIDAILAGWKNALQDDRLGFEQVQQAMRRLATAGLVVPAPEPPADRYQLPPSDLLSLLLEDLDAEAEVSKALGALAGEANRGTQPAPDPAVRLVFHNAAHRATVLRRSLDRAIERLNGVDPSTEEANAELQRSRALLQRLDDTIAKARDWQRNPNALEPVDLANLVDTIQNPLEDEYEGISVERDAAATHEPLEGAVVMGNPNLLEAVLRSLVDNAIREMQRAHGGGRLRLSVSLMEDPERDPAVQVDVDDSGPGVDPEVLELIWTGKHTSKPGGQGSGNGLPDALHVVRGYGGTIEHVPDRSDLGGAHFRVLLPSVEVPGADRE